jgi:energy-coupling factor transporter transmembrane protein EcfT
MFVGETFFQGGSFNPKSMSTDAILKVSLFVLSLIGLVLTWKWELMGAIIALAAYVGLLIIIDTEPIKFYFLLIYPIIPILFIVLWAIRRNVVEKNEEIQNI